MVLVKPLLAAQCVAPSLRRAFQGIGGVDSAMEGPVNFRALSAVAGLALIGAAAAWSTDPTYGEIAVVSSQTGRDTSLASVVVTPQMLLL